MFNFIKLPRWGDFTDSVFKSFGFGFVSALLLILGQRSYYSQYSSVNGNDCSRLMLEADIQVNIFNDELSLLSKQEENFFNHFSQFEENPYLFFATNTPEKIEKEKAAIDIKKSQYESNLQNWEQKQLACQEFYSDDRKTFRAVEIILFGSVANGAFNAFAKEAKMQDVLKDIRLFFQKQTKYDEKQKYKNPVTDCPILINTTEEPIYLLLSYYDKTGDKTVSYLLGYDFREYKQWIEKSSIEPKLNIDLTKYRKKCLQLHYIGSDYQQAKNKLPQQCNVVDHVASETLQFSP